jgi:hypothetical protein
MMKRKGKVSTVTLVNPVDASLQIAMKKDEKLDFGVFANPSSFFLTVMGGRMNGNWRLTELMACQTEME